jgi:putative hydrolase
MVAGLFNRFAAGLLRECASLLEQQATNPFRVNAYRRAAQALESLPRDARGILASKGPPFGDFQGSRAGLTELPFIGEGIAQAIVEIAKTGRLSRLDRLRGAAAPEDLLRMIPGIGRTLAHRIHDELGIASGKRVATSAAKRQCVVTRSRVALWKRSGSENCAWPPSRFKYTTNSRAAATRGACRAVA